MQSLRTTSVRAASVFSGSNTHYAEAMYEAWKENPKSVHASWRAYFEGEAKGLPAAQVFSAPGQAAPAATSSDASEASILAHYKVENLIRNYASLGHFTAKLDPLNLTRGNLSSRSPPELTLEHYGFTEADLSRKFLLPPVPRFDSHNRPSEHTLGDIVSRLKSTYCGNVGYEFLFIKDQEQVEWLRNKIETPRPPHDDSIKRDIMKGLIEARGFEKFLQKKFVTEKRFGVDGCEVLIPGLKRMFERASELGVDTAVLGMAHRGRLNVLANVMKKPIEVIFNEFQSTLPKDSEGSGDVKYHLGMANDVVYPATNRTLHISLLANPSHLEAVNPLVQGKVRAIQETVGDKDRTKTLPILIHGDAAFAGQGVVYETFGFTQLPAYKTGGTIHIVTNNQVGFTTDPRFSRSTPYCTEIAQVIGAPIFHVNSDDPEAVVRCFELATEFRHQFGVDAVIDIVCYRRYGHNEADQPSFTQPLMYKVIEKMTPVDEKYAKTLIEAGTVTKEWVADLEVQYDKNSEDAFARAPTYEVKRSDYLASPWEDELTRIRVEEITATGVPRDVLVKVGKSFSQHPADFNVHKALKRILKAREETIDKGKDIDWATGEALAFGSLLLEGHHVRLSGQDVERGTFSQRHHVLHDQEVDGKTYNPLQHLSENQAKYAVSNSHLSEYAVMGFELGYSQANPNALILWEAQFGDFSNTAQCIIDQFLSSGEAKWRRQTGLVLLLPHGYEGMGPEHSSARLERFLQLSDDEEEKFPTYTGDFEESQIIHSNWQVCNPTTPANYFHLLRRQIQRSFRKPLIVMSPKSLLRHPQCKSDLSELETGTKFHRVIPETSKVIMDNSSEVRRVIFCTGKVYYDLVKEREARGISDVAIARVEQISPFPFDLVKKHADEFPNANIVWAQEEPKNMGAWAYVNPRIETALAHSDSHKGERAKYVGRHPCASVATGNKHVHYDEQEEFLNAAFTL